MAGRRGIRCGRRHRRRPFGVDADALGGLEKIVKKKSAGPAIDWEAVKDRLEQNRLSWGKPPEDDPRRLAAIMEGRERQLSERRRRGRARREETPFLIFSLGPERYGMALKDLAEVAPFRAVA